MIRLTLLAATGVLCALAALPAPLPGSAPAPAPPKMPRESFTETVTVRLAYIPETPTEKSAKFHMVFVPGGEFTMGDEADGPPHKVKVGNFWMARCEVTWDEYDLFRSDQDFPQAGDQQAKNLGPDAVTRPTYSYVDETYGHEREDHPALCMTHHAAM